KAIACHRGVADLAEPREVYQAPVDLADIRKAPRDRAVDRAHRELQALVLFREVAPVVKVAQHDHRPGADEKVAAMGHHHVAVQNSRDGLLAPVETADQYVDA